MLGDINKLEASIFGEAGEGEEQEEGEDLYGREEPADEEGERNEFGDESMEEDDDSEGESDDADEGLDVQFDEVESDDAYSANEGEGVALNSQDIRAEGENDNDEEEWTGFGRDLESVTGDIVGGKNQKDVISKETLAPGMF